MQNQDEKEFQMIGMEKFDHNSRNVHQKRLDLQVLMQGFTVEDFDNILYVIFTRTFYISGGAPARFQYFCQNELYKVSVTGDSQLQILEYFQSAALKSAGQSASDACMLIKKFLVEFKNQNQKNNEFCQTLRIEERELNFDKILSSFWVLFCLKIQKILSEGNLDQYRPFWRKFVKNNNPQFLINVSKERASILVNSYCDHLKENYHNVFKDILQSVKNVEEKVSEETLKLFLEHEIEALKNYMVEAILNTHEILTIDCLKTMIENFFLSRCSPVDTSACWSVWEVVSGNNSGLKIKMQTFVENANKLVLSVEAWKAIAALVFAFCQKLNFNLEDIFDSSFLVLDLVMGKMESSF